MNNFRQESIELVDSAKKMEAASSDEVQIGLYDRVGVPMKALFASTLAALALGGNANAQEKIATYQNTPVGTASEFFRLIATGHAKEACQIGNCGLLKPKNGQIITWLYPTSARVEPLGQPIQDTPGFHLKGGVLVEVDMKPSKKDNIKISKACALVVKAANGKWNVRSWDTHQNDPRDCTVLY